MIEVKDLYFSYGDEGFSMRIPQLLIEKNEKVAIIGPSGTGKTTLINLLAGILLPASGAIKVDGLDITEFGLEDRQDLRAVKMGLVFQEFELLEYLNVQDNILLPYRVSPILDLDSAIVESAQHLAADVGLDDKLKRRPAHLSQGERQRTAVCRALLTKPSVIFGDEPTGNLDPDNRDHVMDILFSYCQEAQAPLVVVTHDHELIERFERVVDVREFGT